MLYIGARIIGSAADAEFGKARIAGLPVPEMPAAEPSDLADVLWNMHRNKDQRETCVPEGIVDFLNG